MIDINLKEWLQEESFSDPTEVRAQKNRQQSIFLQKGVVRDNAVSEEEGLSVRVRKAGAWGFAAGSDMGEEDLALLLKEAQNNAHFLQHYQKSEAAPLPKVVPIERQTLLERGEEVPQEELLELAQEVDSILQVHGRKLTSRSVAVQRSVEERMLYTSEGVYSRALMPRAILVLQLFMEDLQGKTVRLRQQMGGLGSLRDHFSDREKMLAEIQRNYEFLCRKAEGIVPKAGLKEVILDSDLAGILAHEAVGHTVEADLVSAGSVAASRFGQPVASDLVTLVDFAHEAFGKMTPNPLYIDDEGIEARDALLIDRGILRAYMHNRESAQKYHHPALGNARASAWYDEPLIRMRNTCILPGKNSLEELISSVEDGYYLMRPTNGQADTTGEFMFGVSMGFEIKQGKLGRALKDTTISGLAFDVLKKVSMLSDELTWIPSAMCGKKQMISVGMGGPAIRTHLFVGGES